MHSLVWMQGPGRVRALPAYDLWVAQWRRDITAATGPWPLAPCQSLLRGHVVARLDLSPGLLSGLSRQWLRVEGEDPSKLPSEPHGFGQ